MVDYTLNPQSPLDEIKLKFGKEVIAELVSQAIVSIAIPKGGRTILSEALMSAFKIDIPAVGESTTSKIMSARLLGMQQDQIFLLSDYTGPSAVKRLPTEVQEAAYMTDQSDSWVAISVFGAKARSTLQRTCPVDLHPTTVQTGKVIRTVMNHISTVILCVTPNSFLLLSPRSSSKSFLKILQTSFERICEPI